MGLSTLSTHYDPYGFLCLQGLDVPLPDTENTRDRGLAGYCLDQHRWHESRPRAAYKTDTADIRACYLLARLQHGHEAALEAALNRASHPVDTRIISKWMAL